MTGRPPPPRRSSARSRSRIRTIPYPLPRGPGPGLIVEQQPESTARDRELEQAADRAWSFADAQLRADPRDARALFARGAARGVRSRHHLFRAQRTEAARTAAEMRDDLRAARVLDPEDADVLFGLGLYDYYVAVLPRFARLLRFFARLPGGDRARGLRAIEEAATRSTLHDVEARVQLYEIHAFYEGDPEAAAGDMEELAHRYPGWPLWGLKLAEHLRDRLGAYAESAAVARRMLGPGDAARPDAGAAALALARSPRRVAAPRPAARTGAAHPSPSRCLVGSARTRRARATAHRAQPRARRQREGALAHYRAAVSIATRARARRPPSPTSSPRRRSKAAATGPGPAARESGRGREAATHAQQALTAWPDAREAALIVAERELGRAAEERARTVDRRSARGRAALAGPWSRLLRARQADLKGDREAAVELQGSIRTRAGGRSCDAASEGLRVPFRPGVARDAVRPRTSQAHIDPDRSWSGFSRCPALFNSGVHRLSLNS
jgi:hypothetical protein